jgi:hypothetical protein
MLQGIVEFVFESPLEATRKGIYQILKAASEINNNILLKKETNVLLINTHSN